MNTTVPTTKFVSAARIGLPTQCESCAFAPAWNGIIAPAITAKSKIGPRHLCGPFSARYARSLQC